MRPPAALALAALLAALPAACNVTPAPHPDHQHLVADAALVARVESEVRAALDAFLAAQRARDADALIGFLAPSFSMLVDGERVDRAGTVASIRDTLPSLRELDTRFEDVRVIVITRDAALASFVFREQLVLADGSRQRVRGPTSMLWERRDGRWRLVFADSDHYASP